MRRNQDQDHRRPRPDLTDLTLILAWLVSLLAPPALRVATDRPTAIGISSLLVSVAIGLTAGFHYGRHHDAARLWAAFVFGSVTASAVATTTALANGGPDAAPWGAVVILNTLVNTGGTCIAIAIGALASRWLRSSTPQP
jgi:hypothetical protein